MQTHARVIARHPCTALRLAALFSGALTLAACKTFSPDGGMDLVADVTAQEIRKDVAAIKNADDAQIVRERVAELLKKPLSADRAVQIALLHNRGLQAAYNELGLAEARFLEASLPPNPTFSVSRLSGPLEIEFEKKIVANILALATLPLRTEIAEARFRQAQLRAAEETLRVAAEARRSFYRALAANEMSGFLAQAKEAANAASQLATRLRETGAINKLDQTREQAFDAELAAQAARSRQTAASERERLIRAMGLWGADLNFKLPSALPALPTRPQSLPSAEIEALRRRVDLQIARIELEALAKTAGLTQATRFLNLLEAAGIEKTTREQETGQRVRNRGFELEFQIPIFDGGEVRVRQANETYAQAVNRLTEKAVNVRSEAREAYRSYRSAYDIAQLYRRNVLPLRKIISEETMLRYNAMQIDVFSLLTEARQRLAATISAIEAQRDFHLAGVDLQSAIAGGRGGVSTASAASPSIGGGEAGGH